MKMIRYALGIAALLASAVLRPALAAEPSTTQGGIDRLIRMAGNAHEEADRLRLLHRLLKPEGRAV